MTRTRNLKRIAVALVAALAVVAAAWHVVGPDAATPAHAALHATPATLAKVFGGAKGGETILLSPGDYGTFRGGEKASLVTLRSAKRGAARMTLNFNPTVNVRVEGMTLGSAEIAGKSRHVEVADSRFTGGALIRADQMVDAGILFERNRHRDIDVCSECFEGRLDVTGDAGKPAGITIRRSIFGPGGNADGIQSGGNGVRILDNEFVGIHESGGVHTDAIQLYGSRRTVIRGNWIHDTSSGIVAADGADHELIEDNLIDPGGYPFAISISSDNGSVIRHNTLPGGACAFELHCGIVSLGAKPGDPPGGGTIVRDNVLSEVSVKPGATVADQRDNLLAADRVLPVFAGGAGADNPGDFRLAGGSPGKGAASDGSDLGIGAGSPGPS